MATRDAAKAALEAATRAEASALKTAEAAKSAALHAVNDLAEADLADATELAAKEQYRISASDAADRQREGKPPQL